MERATGVEHGAAKRSLAHVLQFAVAGSTYQIIYKTAGDGGRTRDIQLGKLALYQLSYTRIF